jgi:type I restriction enzyme S subunit
MSFPRYPAYKPSGVKYLGKVPTDWRVTPLKTVARVINGYPFDSKQFDPSDGFPLVRIRDLNQSSPDTRYKGEFVESASIDNDDVLIGMDGDFNVGRWLGETPALLNQRMCCVRAETPMITRYLQYALPAPLDTINKLTYATTVKHLSSYDILKIRLAIPPHASQISAIVTFLDRETSKIDALIAEQQRLVELLQEKRQALISHAVTKGLNPDAPMKDSGVEWLGEIPEHWEVKQVRHILKSLTQGSSPNCLPDPAEGDEYGVLKVGCVNGIGFLPTENKALPPESQPDLSSLIRQGDVLMSRGNTRELVGLAALVTEAFDRLMASDLIFVLRVIPQKIHPGFLVCSLRSRHTRSQLEPKTVGTSASMQKINQSTIKEIYLPIPPLAEQTLILEKIQEEVQQAEENIGNSREAIALLQERRSALISAAVTGQIDVRGLVPEVDQPQGLQPPTTAANI